MPVPCPALELSAETRIDDLMAEHARPLLAYVRTILRDHHAAEDVVQETMVKAWQHESRLSAERGSVRGWLLTVARNLALDRVRSAASRHEVLSADGEVPHTGSRQVDGRARLPLGGLDGPADRADQTKAMELRDEVTSLLAVLSPAHREVLAWTYLVGLRENETAERLGVPAGTVKSRRHYALAELRRRAQQSSPVRAPHASAGGSERA